jgi:hypothetical protein
MLAKKVFLLESLRITLFCAAVTALFWLFGADNETILIVFNMAVMSAAATFVPQRKPTIFMLIGSSVIVLATVIGGIVGYYWPWWSKLIGIILATLAFYLPKRRVNTNVCVTAVLMFFIFAALPFTPQVGLHYLLSGIVVIALFALFHRLIEGRIYPTQVIDMTLVSQNRLQAGLTAGIALVLGVFCMYCLAAYTTLSHLYWIALTILVVIQGAQGKPIKTALVRIAVNTAGALFIVVLFGYVIPASFWLELAMLVLFLFLIFAWGFSYVFRTLFIELFVLGFIHLLGKYHDIVAYDRILLTLIGGMLVILSTWLVTVVLKK